MAEESKPLSPGVRISALIVFLGIGLGAFGAHALPESANESTWKTGSLYHLLHGLALFVLALTGEWPRRKVARICWMIGILLFSGSLYLLTFPDMPRWLGPVTPLGGLSFMVGWLAIVLTREGPGKPV
ncbi:MAG: DUF423 domain-containing protein [Verrucomicrobiales bacterium]|nr:DUF423 domain-containing protein [Verrucomicrobiales bacterium]